MKNNQPAQQIMFDPERAATCDSGSVTCLGMTFENDEARRVHFWGFSVLNRYRLRAFSHVNQYLNGVYYVPSQTAEPAPRYNIEGKLSRRTKAFHSGVAVKGHAALTTGTTARLSLPDDSKVPENILAGRPQAPRVVRSGSYENRR